MGLIKIKGTLLLVITLCCLNASYAQQPIGDEEPSVKVIARVIDNSIKLRWAPNTPTLWKYANEFGYHIERHTILKDGQVLEQREIKRLTATPIKPRPMMEWESFVDQNDNAAIAAQALYGDDFEVDMQEGGNPMMQILNQAQMLEQRFAFALYAADNNYEVAQWSGLAFEDSNLVQGERYLYKIIPAIPAEKLQVTNGAAYIGLADVKKLPMPQEFVGVFKDQNVLLTWNYKILEAQYNSYILERSDDLGKSFSPVSKEPLTPLSDPEVQNTGRMVYMDSIPQNNKEYQYRLKGISPFGEQGPVSNTVSGKGVKGQYYNPALIDATLSKDEQSVVLKWEFPQDGMEALSHFVVSRANQAKGDYVPIVTKVDKNKRSLTTTSIEAINYYRITAVGLDGSTRNSFPSMVQPSDTTPPADPVGLSGVIDSTGVVTLKWNQNIEPDFLGYRVFRANLEEEEFTQITFKPTPYNTIIDTIPVKTLVKKVYYKVQAFDKRYNPSGFSEILELKRPDIIPPTPPVIKAFKVEDDSVALQWTPSSSQDAVKTVIYRKVQGSEEDWQLVGEIPIADTSFVDTEVKAATGYLYTLLTVDDSGLESEPIVPVQLSIPAAEVNEEINRFNSAVNRELQQINLSWGYRQQNVSEFQLFRAKEGEQPTLYKVFEADQKRFIDRDLLINTKYTYLLQAVFANGSRSKIAKVEVNY
ncbi:hypothetical protein [Aquimarina brevivitae]|uniref:Fibronectin type-III domain-containing protein n=1 Tax=Aquimarina brevivitae TaxID=323412 RepID=A0A4Q7NYD6_9FLAO|nr:hypothetical protein [Aquimarina brevivitae]RZS92433.1 hypothetical protein EV197_2571 [Aquimarina brevivitae]